MDVNLATALHGVQLAMQDVSEKASVRRLNIYREKSPCKAGCSDCCSRLIFITVAEAIVIQDYLVKTGRWNSVKRRSEEIAQRSMTTPVMSWYKMKISCPVLDPESKLCQGYKVRPAICSTHFVTSPAELCDPWTTSPGNMELADMDDLLNLFFQKLDREIDGHGILATRLPIPVALIFAEKIKTQSGLSSEEAIRLIFTEYT